MAKARTLFVCQTCGHESPRWLGKCPSCEDWNSFVEERAASELKAPVIQIVPTFGRGTTTGGRAQRLAEVAVEEQPRLVTGMAEFDRVMGGGIMLGSLTLIAGDPGIGKSTLMTELGRFLPAHTILYVTGEESARQVKLRAQRLGVDTGEFYLLAETNVEEIIAAAQEIAPDVMVVDSIQTIYRPDIASAPGSVSQVRESTAALLTLTKQMATATFLVGHVTKAGAIAGPRVLEHMVDTVVYFEGDRHHAYRILRTVKNRFGASGEIGIFEMREDGFREVKNASEILLSERQYGQSGSAIVCAMEGTRPLLVEIQALVSPASYGTPQRTATGFDPKRLQVLLAVLEKREGMRLSQHDVFLNVAGGVRLEEPAVDLGVAVAIASSLKDLPADSATVLVGEVGLGGEVRAVSRIEARLAEIAKLGFEQAIIPAASQKGLRVPKGLKARPAARLGQALEIVL
jgi:DNA repair protein RadA/Sms